MSVGKTVAGAVAGIAAGTILGVLIAPEKGAKTRKKIMKKGNEALAEIKVSADSIVKNISGKIEELKERTAEKATEIHDEVKDKMKEQKHKITTT